MISKNFNKSEDVNGYLELSEFSEDMVFKFGREDQEEHWMDLAGEEFDIAEDYDVEALLRKY